MKLRLAVLFISTCLAACVMAQVNINGVVADAKTKEKIEFANLVLLKPDSTFYAGASSDANGVFTFENVVGGNYILSSAFFGYKKTFLPVNTNEKTNLGNIFLTPSDVMLDEVTVTAQSVIQKHDRKIITPSEAQIKASNSGVTLLRNLQLSRIIVNPISNEVALPGGDEVQLRINGVEVTIAEVVALQPSDIIRIEYHDDPGMRYGGAGAVIDYITRRRESGGNVSLNLSEAPASDMGWGENFVSAKVNHKKSEFGVNAYWSHRKIDWTRENKETFVFPDKILERVEEGEPTRFKQDRLNTSLNYNLNEQDKYLFNARFRFRYNDSPNDYSDRESTIYSSDNNTPLSIIDHSTSRSKSPSLDLYYQRNLKKDQVIIFNVVGTYIDSRSTRLYQERRGDDLNTDIYSCITGDKYSLIAEGIYERKIKEGKLSAGIKHNQSYTNNTYAGNIATDVNLKFSETYAYAEYQWRKSKFNYTLGLGVMRTYNSQGESKNEKYVFRPKLRVAYNINDNAYIRYNGYISAYSPSLSNLNDVEQAIDSLQIRRGNPDLRTAWFYTNTLNAGYNKGIFGAELFVRYSYDRKPSMEQILFEDGKFVRTTENHKGFHRLNMETTFKLKPYKDYISLLLAPGVNRYISYGNNFTHTYTNWYVRASLNANYKRFYFNADVWTRRNYFWAETLNLGERLHTVSAGYNAKNWSVGAVMFNPFSKNYTQGSRNYSDLVPTRSDVYTDKLGQTFIVTFSMNLNFGRQFKAGNKRINNDDSDSGIMSGTK